MAIQNQDGTWQPGIIYELRVCIDGTWLPFYVGETTDPTQRLADHYRRSRPDGDDKTLKYQAIRDFESAGYQWDLFPVCSYGAEGPEDLENQCIIEAIQAGAGLQNEKKGNENWMIQMQTAAQDMIQRGITSYREYREITNAEREQRRQRVHDQAHRAPHSKDPDIQRAIDEWSEAPTDPNRCPPAIRNTLAVIRDLQARQERTIKKTRTATEPDRSQQQSIWDAGTQDTTPDAALRCVRYFEESGEPELAEYWLAIYEERLRDQ